MDHTWKAQMGGFLRGGIARCLYDLKFEVEARFPGTVLDFVEQKDWVHSEYWMTLKNAPEEAAERVQGVLRDIFTEKEKIIKPHEPSDELTLKEFIGCFAITVFTIAFLVLVIGLLFFRA